MTPWLDDGDVRLYHGDCLSVLAGLPERSVQTVVTSPPYWGLRDYGTGEWDGGDPSCNHSRPAPNTRGGLAAAANKADGGNRLQENRLDNDGGLFLQQYRDVCGRCGARRVDQQIGLEESPTAYVERLVAVFRGVWRVLRDDGTVWLNLGDSYAHSLRQSGAAHAGAKQNTNEGAIREGFKPLPAGLKEKDLVGIPWRVAFALQADGWYLRSDIIWAKPNPMPESVTDRPTKAHEYLFLLSKHPRYYWDADAVRETITSESSIARNRSTPRQILRAGGRQPDTDGRPIIRAHQQITEAGRNVRSVWEISTQPTPEAHFATYPEELVRRCILAGTSERGECVECGAPWVRVVYATAPDGRRARMNGRHGYDESGKPLMGDNMIDQGVRGSFNSSHQTLTRETAGWEPSCRCSAPTRPQTVLDPFIGSGTTALVARKHGRQAIGIDLNESYLQIASRRLQQLSLFAGVD